MGLTEQSITEPRCGHHKQRLTRSQKWTKEQQYTLGLRKDQPSLPHLYVNPGQIQEKDESLEALWKATDDKPTQQEWDNILTVGTSWQEGMSVELLVLPSAATEQ